MYLKFWIASLLIFFLSDLPDNRSEEASMQLVEREEIDEEDDLFEAIDKRKIEIDFSFSDFACVVITVIRIFDLCSLRSISES